MSPPTQIARIGNTSSYFGKLLYFHYALDHFADQGCAAGWKVMYPVREVLSLVLCGTIASSDDYDDIVDWGNAHLALLRERRQRCQ